MESSAVTSSGHFPCFVYGSLCCKSVRKKILSSLTWMGEDWPACKAENRRKQISLWWRKGPKRFVFSFQGDSLQEMRLLHWPAGGRAALFWRVCRALCASRGRHPAASAPGNPLHCRGGGVPWWRRPAKKIRLSKFFHSLFLFQQAEKATLPKNKISSEKILFPNVVSNFPRPNPLPKMPIDQTCFSPQHIVQWQKKFDHPQLFFCNESKTNVCLWQMCKKIHALTWNLPFLRATQGRPPPIGVAFSQLRDILLHPANSTSIYIQPVEWHSKKKKKKHSMLEMKVTLLWQTWLCIKQSWKRWNDFFEPWRIVQHIDAARRAPFGSCRHKARISFDRIILQHSG